MPAPRKYTEEQRRECVAIVVSTGSFLEAERATGIGAATIRYWKNSCQDWWDKVAAECWEAIGTRMQGRYQRINDEATKLMLERMRKGDVKVLSNGKKVKVPIPFKDLCIAAGISHDKLHAPAIKVQDEKKEAQERSGTVTLAALQKTLRDLDKEKNKAARDAASDPDSNVESIDAALASQSGTDQKPS